LTVSSLLLSSWILLLNSTNYLRILSLAEEEEIKLQKGNLFVAGEPTGHPRSDLDEMAWPWL